MKHIHLYTLAVMALTLSSCSMEESVERLPADKPASEVTGKVTVSFSAMMPEKTVTKAVIDPSEDIHSLHLIVFDETGMLVETCEAETWGDTEHGDHHDGRNYKVTLTLSEEKRYIHFIANCPAPDKIAYGHEASVIGNMYVKNHATAYWARVEVPYILVQEDTDNDGIYQLVENIQPFFDHVPLLRNYAEITISDATEVVDTLNPPRDRDAFYFAGYTVYNTIDRGTVAPYNNTTQSFQSFLAPNSASYTYPQLLDFGYQGHVLASSVFQSELPRDENDKIIVYEPEEPFYLYERKVSVKTNEEDKWLESPPHIIIKGRYKPENSTTWTTYYYKVDLVYNVMSDPNETPDNPDDDLIDEIKYYNILRNFSYHFDIVDVHDKGYDTISEAMAGASGNNLSGSSSASKLDNISDHVGRLWVSYTDTTLVTGDAVSLKYKYIQNAFDPSSANYNVITNDAVSLENAIGEVISAYEVMQTNEAAGQWKGYREIILYINQPGVKALEQAVRLKTNSANLTREVRYYLKQRFQMEVECTPKVSPEFGESVEVKIKLPTGLTDDMFPLELQIEVFDKTLSPDVSKNEYSLPVKSATSIIPEKKGERSFHYVVTIPDEDTYKALDNEGAMKVLPTDWLTNLEDNESTVYVDNKYFELAWDSWENYIYEFTDPALSLTDIPYGVGRELTVSYTLDGDDANWLSRDVTLKLSGLSHPGAQVNQKGEKILTVNAASEYVTRNGNRVTVSGFETAAESKPVSVYIDADEYLDANLNATRSGNEFTDLSFDPGTLAVGPDIPVTFSFNLPAYYENMVVNVEIDGLVPADDETSLVEVDGRSTIRNYTYIPTSAGPQEFSLKTINNEPCTCMISLDTPDQYYYAPATHSVAQTPVSYHFNARFAEGTPQKINSNSEVTVLFDINEGDGYKEDMVVYVTLGKLMPKDTDQNLRAISDGVYRYAVKQPGPQSFIVKPSTTEAGTCTITLAADEYYYVSEDLTIEQTNATYALKMSNARSQNQIYNSQVCYTLDQPLARNATYTFKCKVKATSNVNITVYLQQSNGTTQKCDGQSLNGITTNWDDGTMTIKTNNNDFDMITFNIGQFVGDVYLDNVSLKRDNNKTELMKNNNFETGNGDGWMIKGNATFEIVPEGYVAQ